MNTGDINRERNFQGKMASFINQGTCSQQQQITGSLNVQSANIMKLFERTTSRIRDVSLQFRQVFYSLVQSAYKRGCTGMVTSLDFGKMERLPICKSGFLVLLQERLSSSSMLKFISSLLVRLHAMYNSHKT